MLVVSLLTIRHSGSHFFTDHLFKGWLSGPPDAQPDRGKHTYIFAHLNEAVYANERDKFLTWPIVSPMRRPEALVATHHRRYDTFYHLDRELAKMVELDSVSRVSFLPLDAPDRASWLRKLNNRLGLNLQTDWPVMGHWEGEGTNEAKVAEVWKHYGAFFERFYEHK